MPELPEQITIPTAELKSWLEHIQRGLEPAVKYSDDAVKMQSAAYTVRGDMLGFLNHRIRAFVPEGLRNLR